MLGGDPFDGGDRVVKALRARLGERVTIMGGFLFAFAPDVLKQVGRAPAASTRPRSTCRPPRSP